MDFRKLFGGGGGGSGALPPSVPLTFDTVGDTPAWGDIKAGLEATATGQALAKDKAAWEVGEGPAHNDAKLRLFGSTGEPRVTLFRDKAGWCPYCQKVWLLLEEKRIPYRVEKVPMRSYGDKPAWFLEKVPSGLLPAVELDGALYTDSLPIMHLLESAFPEARPSLPPDGSKEALRARELLKLERELFSWWCTVTFRPSGPMSRGGAEGFKACLDRVENALADDPSHPWLVKVGDGSGPSLVDLQLVSHAERMAASLLYWKGVDLRNGSGGGSGSSRWTGLERWFRAFEERPAYLATKSDYYTHCQDIPPQYGPGFGDAAGAPFAAAIDGKGRGGGSNWHLPLPPLGSLAAPEPHHTAGGWGDADEEAARHAAGLRLVGNAAAVVAFALRGAGQTGAQAARKRFQAPLADPYAEPAEDPAVRSGADLLLRTAAFLLLEGRSGDLPGSDPAFAAAAASLAAWGPGAGVRTRRQVGDCGRYLRDRVGVPRDLPFPGARQLRAHLNWCIDQVDPQ